ncbi:MAG: ABC transporter permease subunit [Anaerolineae bacterium]
MTQMEAPAEALIPDVDTQPRRHVVALGPLLHGARRLAVGLLVLLAVLYITHVGLALSQGAPPATTLGEAARASVAYLGRLLHGDLGLSAAGSVTLLPRPVAEVLRETVVRTLGLLAVAISLAALVGVGLGLAAAVRRGSAWSLPILLASIVGVSLPSFLLALVLQLLLLGLARLAGRSLLPVGGFGWDGHVILPALVLAARPIAQITRVTFVSVSEALTQDYVATARGKGVPGRLVLTRHVLRNVAVPVLTTVGVSLRFALSSLPVVELFFGWPGAGLTLLKAISRQDANLTVALVLALATLFILVNLLLEVLYRLVDPRLRQAAAAPRPIRSASPFAGFGALLAEVRDTLGSLPLVGRLLHPRRSDALPRLGPAAATPSPAEATRPRASVRSFLSNTPLAIGTVLVAGIALIYLVGPHLAPHSPYTTINIEFANGTFVAPPFAPGAEYPLGTDMLGRDLLSLILAGTQQTLTLVLVAVAVRLLVGSVLGAVAGWLSGSRVDRALLTLVEVFAAYPALLLAMTFVLAVGIRKGMSAFVVALCFVGWGEVMQFVRAQLMSIRPRQYVEAALATGVRAPRILLRHVLPNLLPSLISLAALEMGSVLMLLGELGFVGIFIGGGAFVETRIDDPLYHYSDVPEWGSLLSSVRAYARSYTWTAVYPALAFFIAILGFNLFGEGLRRRVEEHGLDLSRLVNRYTVAAALMLVLGAAWLRDNTGAVAFYRQQAAAFSGEQALVHATALTDPALMGRALGTAGMDATADYVAQQFEALGLQPGGEDFTYFQTRPRAYSLLTGVPALTLDDGQAPPLYRQDYREYFAGYRTAGSVAGPVRFVATGPLTARGNVYGGIQDYVALSGVDYTGEILLVLSEADANKLSLVPAAGVLIVTQDTSTFGRNYTLSPATRTYWSVSGTESEDAWRPAMYVSEALADRILAPTGQTVAKLRRLAAGLGQDELASLPTGANVSLDIPSTVQEVSTRQVVGHLPGQSEEWDGRLVVVLAQYDTPPPTPDGIQYPGANDDASGVAVMLEAIRVLQQTEYEPYRTLLFIAYSGEGLEKGRPMSEPEVAEFLKAKYGFSSAFEIDAVVRLRGLGAGSGEGLAISAGGNQRLAGVFEAAARRMGVGIGRERETMDLGIVFEEADFVSGGQEAPSLRLTWNGWQATARLPEDALSSLSAEKLEQAGRTLALALMVIGRDTSG